MGDQQDKPNRGTWYSDWFNEAYLTVYSHRNPESAAAEVRAVARLLDLNKMDRVLDLCCGSGRHLHHLKEFDAVGLDLSPDLLGAARKGLGPSATLVRGDMRDLPFTATFDAVICLFTSFGYFLDDEQNLQVLKEIANTLVHRGRFLLDLVSAGVTHNLVPETVRNQSDLEITERRRFVSATERLEKEILIRGPEGTHKFIESVRVYSFKEVRTMLAMAGLAMEFIYGDFDESPYGPGSEQMIVVGRMADRPPEDFAPPALTV